MKRALLAATVAGVVAAISGCGSGSDAGNEAGPTQSETAPSPSRSVSKTPSRSASAASVAPSATSPTAAVVTERAVPINLDQSYVVVGDWFVGVPTESSAGGSAALRLRGFNWRTGVTWESTPLVGLPPALNPESATELAEENGAVVFLYESSEKGTGLNADANAYQMVVLDAANGKTISHCSPSAASSGYQAPTMTSAGEGPALVRYSSSGLMRLDVASCAQVWPAVSSAGSGPLVSSAGKILTNSWALIDAQSGSTVWNRETVDIDYTPGLLGLVGNTLVSTESSEIVTYRDFATGQLQGNSVASANSRALDIGNGRVFTLGDGVLTAYDLGGVQVWQRAGLDKNADIQWACFGRLWVYDERTGNNVLVSGDTGADVVGNSPVPNYCMDEDTGLYPASASSSLEVIRPLPLVTASSSASPSTTGSASGSASPSSSASPKPSGTGSASTRS